MLLWKCYGNNKMAAMRIMSLILHLQQYSHRLNFFLASALDGGGWSTPRPGLFTSGKETRYPLYGRLDEPQDRFGRVRKISTSPEFDPRTFQPVVSRYTDYALSAHIMARSICSPIKFKTMSDVSTRTKIVSPGFVRVKGLLM